MFRAYPGLGTSAVLSGQDAAALSRITRARQTSMVQACWAAPMAPASEPAVPVVPVRPEGPWAPVQMELAWAPVRPEDP